MVEEAGGNVEEEELPEAAVPLCAAPPPRVLLEEAMLGTGRLPWTARIRFGELSRANPMEKLCNFEYTYKPPLQNLITGDLRG